MERDVLRWSGAVAAVVTLGGILLATVASPAFVWRSNALSDLGVTTTAAGTTTTVLLFNGSLVLGSVLGLAFAAYLFRVTGGRERVVAVSLGATLGLMGLVGVFPHGTSLHLPVALGFYLLLSVTVWIAGVLAATRGDWRWATVSVLVGLVNILGWAAWAATGDGLQSGIAVPEYVGALALGAWVLARTDRLVRGHSPT